MQLYDSLNLIINEFQFRLLGAKAWEKECNNCVSWTVLHAQFIGELSY